MKISQAFRTAYKTVAGQKAETAKLLATEFALTVMCLAPLLFLTAKGPEKYCAVLALPLWLLVKVPSRLNAAAVMQDGLEEGKLFSLRMGDPGNYRAKLRYALIRLGLLLLWAAPLIAALLYAWEKYTGRTDGLTVLQMIYEFGGKDMKTGIIYLLLILAALLILWGLGAGFHSGDRHAWVLEEKDLLKKRRLGVLGCRLASLVFLLPLIVAAIVVVFRYAPLLNDVSGVVSGDVPRPSSRVTLIILGIGTLLTVPLIPIRSMVTAAYVKGLK
ncbi:MAG: hypothetical protein IKO25_12100 [Clostridia bacterium]|nr:hypothetical protein [Clostridia bacterium]